MKDAEMPVQQPCVLIVDDEPDIRDTLRDVVEMGGCSALLASNGAQALELLGKHRLCLVILDILMPVMTGVELVEEIRKRPELAALQIVISTSAPSRAPAGLPVLAKPIDIKELWAWMARTCTCAGRS
jgi:CheY-like chemotaxis protein